MATQITRVLRKVDDSQILKKQGAADLPYSGPNLTTMLYGVSDPVFVLQRIDANGNPYPFTCIHKQGTRQSSQQTLKQPGHCY